MVLASDFYQPRKNGKIISFLITKMFVSGQNVILKPAAIGESKDLKRPQKTPVKSTRTL